MLACHANVDCCKLVERLWRTVKYEHVFLNDYQTVAECQRGLKEFFDRYNTRREHQSLEYRYPEEVYSEQCATKRKSA